MAGSGLWWEKCRGRRGMSNVRSRDIYNEGGEVEEGTRGAPE